MSTPDIQILISAGVGSEMVADAALQEILSQPDGKTIVEAIRQRVLMKLKSSDIPDEHAERYLKVLAPAISSANLVIDRALRDHG